MGMRFISMSLRVVRSFARLFFLAIIFAHGDLYAAYDIPDIDEIRSVSDLIIIGDRVYYTSRGSVYVHPVVVLKGVRSNLVEICRDYGKDGYNPAVSPERAFYFLRKNGGCYYGAFGFASDPFIFNSGPYQWCFRSASIYGFSGYDIENVSLVLEVFGFPGDYLYSRGKDCRDLKR